MKIAATQPTKAAKNATMPTRDSQMAAGMARMMRNATVRRLRVPGPSKLIVTASGGRDGGGAACVGIGGRAGVPVGGSSKRGDDGPTARCARSGRSRFGGTGRRGASGSGAGRARSGRSRRGGPLPLPPWSVGMRALSRRQTRWARRDSNSHAEAHGPNPCVST